MIARVVGFLFAIVLTGGSVMAKENVIHVNGKGVISIPTTEAQIEVAVRKVNPSASEVQKQLNKDNNRLMSFLKKQKVRIWKPLSIVSPVRASTTAVKSKDLGYEGMVSIHFVVDLDDLGGILDAVNREGADEIRNIRFKATDEAWQKGL